MAAATTGAAPLHTPRCVARVLHVFYKLERGGAQMRTLDVLRLFKDDPAIETHVIILSGERGDLDEDFQNAGAVLHHVPLRAASFVHRFFRLVRRHRIDVVHAHVHFFSGYILLLAWLAGVPRRICHFRTTGTPESKSVRRRLQWRIGRALVNRFSTAILAVSHDAMAMAFRADWQRDARCRVVFNGLAASNPTASSVEQMRSHVRAEFSFAQDDTVVCHVGRFDEDKNHERLLDIFAALAGASNSARLLLVGSGDSQGQARVREMVARHGLGGRTVITGGRSDVVQILAASDVLLFPSLREGLPGVVLEALSIGTPCVASAIPGTREIAQFCSSVDLVNLAEADKTWAAHVEAATLDRSMSRRLACIQEFRTAPFDLTVAAEALLQEWTG